MKSISNPFVVRRAEPPPRISGLVYAVGDIHGQGDLAHALLQAVANEITRHDGPAIIVTLGDYVDRGPHSSYVLDLLLSLQSYERIETHLLKGNHEDAMLGFLNGRDGAQTWLDYGGIETMASYGVAPPASREPDDLEVSRRALVEAVPPAHRSLLDSLELSYSRDGYFFAHAGADPKVALDDQSPEDLMWIRGRFLDSPKGFDRVVVHGHTPSDEVHADHRRIGIDTGAYITGILTALRLEGESREVIQAARGIRGPEIRRRQI